MKQEKDRWIEDVLRSTAGMKPAAAPVGRFEAILAKTNAISRSPKRISLTTASAAAACLLMLIALNFTLLGNYHASGNQNASRTEASVQDIVDYYELGSNTMAL